MKSLRGYFGIYCDAGIFLASNYDESLLNCVNGLAYHLTGMPNFYKEKDLSQMNNIGIRNEIEYAMHKSDFIQKGKRHFSYKSIKFQSGIIYIFKYEDGSLKNKNKK